MGLFNIFKKGKKSDMSEGELFRYETDLMSEDDGIVGEVEHGGSSSEGRDRHGREGSGSHCSFIMGVLDATEVKGTDDLVVTGYVKGNVKSGISVGAIYYGDDNKSMSPAMIREIEIDGKSVDTASDCHVSLILEGAVDSDIRTGTSLYTRDMGSDTIHDAYVAAISETYVKERALDLSDEEIKMLGITDCSEIWRLNNWYITHEGKDEDYETKEARKTRLEKIILALKDKILQAEEIYYVHDKNTGEAHLYSQTFEKGNDDYICTPPNIMIVSKAYRKHYRKLYNTENTELAIVRNGKDKKGIHNFLAGNFLYNGACGVAVNAVQVSIMAGILVEKPDNTGIPIENIPVTNPNLVRWLLLIGQLDSPKEDKEAALSFRLYYRFLGEELMKSRLIIPMKHQSDDDKDDSDETDLGIATMKGKDDKEAVIMYTDWRRLRSEYGKDWDGMVHRVSGLIGRFDCALNPTKYPAAGMYLTEDMYKGIVKMVKSDRK